MLTAQAAVLPLITTRAVFSGASSLLIHCAEAYQSAGHTVVAVISDDKQICDWAAANDVWIFSAGVAPPLDEDIQFDFIFSLGDSDHLHPDWVVRARSLALEFQASLFHPHAASWALIAQEKQHAVRWLSLAPHASEWRLAKQLSFQLTDIDTAWTVQAACYEKGLESFVSLVADIGQGELRLRTFLDSRIPFDPLQRPRALGTLDFSRPATEIASLVNGLNFGPQPNPVALAKIYLGTSCAVVQVARTAEASSVHAPGVVLHAEGDMLRVSTGDGDIVLTGCSNAGGSPADDIFTASMLLPVPQQELLQQLDLRTPGIARGEGHWQQVYSSLAPVELPYPRAPHAAGDGERAFVAIEVAAKAPAAIAVAAFLSWLSVVATQERVSIMYCDQALRIEADPLDGWLAAWVPITVPVHPEKHTQDIAACVAAVIEQTQAAGPCTHDLALRMQTAPGLLARLEKIGAGVRGQTPPRRMELMLAIDPQADSASLVADEAIFPHDTLAVIARHFSTFLTGFVAGGQIAKIALVPDEEAAETAAANSTSVVYDAASSVQALIAAQTRRTPDHAAICFDGQDLTYRSLEDQSDALAATLQLRGVKPGDIVGICLRRGPEIVVGMLAILKVGAAYLPLDPDYPRERLAFMIEDSATALVLTTAAQATALAIAADKVFVLDAGRDDSAPPAKPFTAPASVARTAYLMYTSGSTGRPKGVLVTQRGLLNLFVGLDHAIAHDRPGRWLAVTSFSFDISVAELWWPLTRGFTVVIHAQSSAGWSVAQAMLSNQITHLFCTPSMLAVLMADAAGRQALSRMSVVMAGGEVFPLQLTTALCAIVPGQVFNVYGPTEITVLSNVCELSRHDKFVPLGRPIANTTVYVRTPHGAECPAWVAGELWIGGDGVSDGYWRRPELTADKFIADPQRPGGRLYRTGDLGRRRPGGALEFVGRIDHQVKIRGHRIELGEIEKTIATLPGVKEAVVLAPADPLGDRRLVAYVVPHADAALESGLIQRGVAQLLPAMMVPGTVLVLRSFPLTANGKIDRGALPSPRSALKAVVEASVEALPLDSLNALERMIADIWQRVLVIGDVKASDNFFDLGGSFFTAVQAQRCLLDTTGQLVHLSDLARFPTVGKLARQIADRSHATGQAPVHSRLPSSPVGFLADSFRESDVTETQNQTPVERVIAGIWRDLFEMEHVARHDDFFALGGHSLAAVRMFAELRQHFPVNLPLSSLLEAPTLAGFAALIAGGLPADHVAAKPLASVAPSHSTSLNQRPWSPLVTICGGDMHRKPIFCIHGSGGNVLNFKGLSKKLGPDQPVYGLQSQGVDGHLQMLESIEAMATQYVNEIRSVDAQGPYRLVGFSAGGVIAFEMAQQLKKAGADVSLLAMIDTLTPAAAARTPTFLKKLWLMRHWSMKFAMERYRNRHTPADTEYKHQQMLEKVTRGEWLPPELAELHLTRHIVRVQNQYLPKPYDGNIIMFKAIDATTPYLLAGDCMGWQAHIHGQIKVVDIPGTHLSMMAEPGVSQLSAALTDALKKLDAEDASSHPNAARAGAGGASRVREYGAATSWLQNSISRADSKAAGYPHEV